MWWRNRSAVGCTDRGPGDIFAFDGSPDFAEIPARRMFSEATAATVHGGVSSRMQRNLGVVGVCAPGVLHFLRGKPEDGDVLIYCSGPGDLWNSIHSKLLLRTGLESSLSCGRCGVNVYPSSGNDVVGSLSDFAILST